MTVQGQKASDLRATAAIDLSRIAGAATFDAFKALADKEKDAEGAFGMALDRMMVAKECGDDLACYGKKLSDPSWTRAEKAAFAIGFSGDAQKGIPLLLGALKPLASINQERFPVHQAILYAVTRLRPRVQGMHRQARQADRARREGHPHTGRTRSARRDARRARANPDQGRQPGPRRGRRRGRSASAGRRQGLQGRQEGQGHQGRCQEEAPLVPSLGSLRPLRSPEPAAHSFARRACALCRAPLRASVRRTTLKSTRPCVARNRELRSVPRVHDSDWAS